MTDAPLYYSYSPATGEYTGTDTCDPSPLEPGVWLVPADATLTAPPAAQAGKANVFADAAWTSVVDDRGQTWYAADASPVVITALGDPAASGLVAVKPTLPPPAPVVPESITDGQFMQALAAAGSITWAECNAYLGPGTIPSIFANAIAKIPTDQDPNAQAKAQARFIGAHTFERHNPLTLTLAAIIGWTDAQLDALWTSGSAIV